MKLERDSMTTIRPMQIRILWRWPVWPYEFRGVVHVETEEGSLEAKLTGRGPLERVLPPWHIRLGWWLIGWPCWQLRVLWSRIWAWRKA